MVRPYSVLEQIKVALSLVKLKGEEGEKTKRKKNACLCLQKVTWPSNFHHILRLFDQIYHMSVP
jgi:hypothetical protein